MEKNNLFNDRYFLERLLGRGNFSEVWLAKDTKTDIQVALKIYAPATGLDDAGLNVFAREFSLVVNANHKNLLKPLYYDSYERKPFLVLPFCKEGSIMSRVGAFSEEEAWRVLRDVASGLAWLHNMNPPVIHQDIKPDNIMIGDNGEFMITDFGVSTHVKSTLRKSLSAAFSSAGTIAYMAPERFSKDNTPIMANDIYSLGATVYELLTGDTPFGEDGGLLQMKGAEVPDLKGNFSPQLKAVISRCLRTNPWERPTAEQLERYAEAGLKGEKIKFDDDKSFWQKNKIWIIGAAIILSAAVIILIAITKHNQEIQTQMEQAKIESAIKAHNDSVLAVARQLTIDADMLKAQGDLHDEGYELSYLKALEFYQTALGQESQMTGESPLPTRDEIISKIDTVSSKLFKAYLSFQEKANLFSDDEDIALEFKERANRISGKISLSKYESLSETQSSPTSSDN